MLICFRFVFSAYSMFEYTVYKMGFFLGGGATSQHLYPNGQQIQCPRVVND